MIWLVVRVAMRKGEQLGLFPGLHQVQVKAHTRRTKKGATVQVHQHASHHAGPTHLPPAAHPPAAPVSPHVSPHASPPATSEAVESTGNVPGSVPAPVPASNDQWTVRPMVKLSKTEHAAREKKIEAAMRLHTQRDIREADAEREAKQNQGLGATDHTRHAIQDIERELDDVPLDIHREARKRVDERTAKAKAEHADDPPPGPPATRGPGPGPIDPATFTPRAPSSTTRNGITTTISQDALGSPDDLKGRETILSHAPYLKPGGVGEDARHMSRISAQRRKDLSTAMDAHHVEPGKAKEIDEAGAKLYGKPGTLTWREAYFKAAEPHLRMHPRDLSTETEEDLDHLLNHGIRKTNPSLHLAAQQEMDRRGEVHRKQMEHWDEGQVGFAARYLDGSLPSSAYDEKGEAHIDKLWGDLPRDRTAQPRASASVKRGLLLEAQRRGYTHAAGEGMASHQRPDFVKPEVRRAKSKRDEVIEQIHAHNAEMDTKAAGEKYVTKRGKYLDAKIDESAFGEKSRRGHDDLFIMLDDARKELRQRGG